MIYALLPGSFWNSTLEDDIRSDTANIHDGALRRKSDSLRCRVRACRAEDGGRFERFIL
jgi:hypothetical protein